MAINLENIIFVGIVSAVNASDGTVIAVRPDKDNRTTKALHVLQRGTKQSKDFWLPAVGDQVLCVVLPNMSGSGPADGFVVGAFYSDVDTAPSSASASTRVLEHAGDLIMNIGGTLKINAGTLDIAGGGNVVASGISLTGHVHGGVKAGGDSTSGPQ